MELNEYSLRCLVALTKAFPQFKDQITTSSEQGCFTIETDSPSGTPFWVTTEGEEITVGFDLHHRHFGYPGQPVDRQDVKDAITYI